jgi:hypothetical protein
MYDASVIIKFSFTVCRIVRDNGCRSQPPSPHTETGHPRSPVYYALPPIPPPRVDMKIFVSAFSQHLGENRFCISRKLLAKIKEKDETL